MRDSQALPYHENLQDNPFAQYAYQPPLEYSFPTNDTTLEATFTTSANPVQVIGWPQNQTAIGSQQPHTAYREPEGDHLDRTQFLRNLFEQTEVRLDLHFD